MKDGKQQQKNNTRPTLTNRTEKKWRNKKMMPSTMMIIELWLSSICCRWRLRLFFPIQWIWIVEFNVWILWNDWQNVRHIQMIFNLRTIFLAIYTFISISVTPAAIFIVSDPRMDNFFKRLKMPFNVKVLCFDNSMKKKKIHLILSKIETINFQSVGWII